MSSTSVFAENCSEMPVSGKLYSIINYSSGAAIDVEKKSKDALANVISWEYRGGSNQHFYLHETADGYWTIRAAHSGMNLDVLGSSTSNGGNIIQWNPTGSANQEWRLKQSSNGAYNIVSRSSRLSLTVAGSYRGANIYQNADEANASQRWYFNPVDSTCGEQGDMGGFASVAGKDGLHTTTGGGNATGVIVRSCDALVTAVSSERPGVIYIPDNTTINCHTANRRQVACAIKCPSYSGDSNKTFYRVPVGSQTCTELGSNTDSVVYRNRNDRHIHVKSNKSIIGLGPNAQITGASFTLGNSKNVIIRNLTIKNVNPGLVEAGDGITLDNSSHIWLDHLKFQNISDGHVDMKNSQNVTLSWNQFDGYNPLVCGNQHHYTSLVQDTQVTLDHNFWNNVSGRNPKIVGSNTRAHIFNNYWRNVTYFAISVDQQAQARLESSFFENSTKPHWNHGGGYLDADIASNRYTGRSATDSYKDSGSPWVLSDTPQYPYSLDSADSLPEILKAGSGPQ
ncbi:pectate lyase [Hahella sp. CCB-MM4]|nr:pectate lyase [Hahella sp. CCB-MM4]